MALLFFFFFLSGGRATEVNMHGIKEIKRYHVGKNGFPMIRLICSLNKYCWLSKLNICFSKIIDCVFPVLKISILFLSGQEKGISFGVRWPLEGDIANGPKQIWVICNAVLANDPKILENLQHVHPKYLKRYITAQKFLDFLQ